VAAFGAADRIPHRAPSMSGQHVPEVSATTRLVGLLGWPVEYSLSPTMQNAAFRAAGLDLLYVALPTRPEGLERALEGVEALGFVGANVTAPHKLEVARLLGTDSGSVNTLVARDGRLEGTSTDTAILDGLAAEQPVVLGDGGAARAFHEALPHALRFYRRGTWPPDVRSADLVVNATSERDAVLVELEDGQTLVDLPYPETATAIAARAAGARVVTGLEVLLAQGAASFRLWTGLEAPVEAMRAAVGLPA
jgi:shikimate dehydrogenase